MQSEEPFGTLPAELPEQAADELLDPRLAGQVLPVRPPASVQRIPHRYRRSAGASVLAAGLIGLRDVVDPARNDQSVIEEQVDERAPDGPIEVYLDPDDPSASMVVVRDATDLN